MSSENSLKSTVLYTAFFVLVPNLFFIILSQFIFVTRTDINFDYLFVGFLFYFFKFPLGYLLFVLIFTLDALFSILPGFHFTDSSILRSLQYIFQMNISYVYIFIPIILVVLYFILKKIKTLATKRSAWICLILMFIIVIFDLIFEKRIGFEDKKPLITYNVSGSTIHKVLLNLKYIFDTRGEMTAHPIAESASSMIFENLPNQALPNRIVYIVIESIGYFHEEAANALQFRAFDNPELLNRYEQYTGLIPFKGSTVPAEIRELCQLEIDTVHPSLKEMSAQRCLVAQLQEQGFNTLAFHGYSGTFFNRLEWYPNLGFDEIFFINELDDLLVEDSRCGKGIFSGVCDTDILKIIHQRLLDESLEKEFIYWLTLNTHLPLPPASTVSHFDCNQAQALRLDQDICTSVALHDQLFNQLVDVLIDSKLPPTLVVLVGDHTTPFISLDARDSLISGMVPYIILWPKS